MTWWQRSQRSEHDAFFGFVEAVARIVRDGLVELRRRSVALMGDSDAARSGISGDVGASIWERGEETSWGNVWWQFHN